MPRGSRKRAQKIERHLDFTHCRKSSELIPATTLPSLTCYSASARGRCKYISGYELWLSRRCRVWQLYWYYFQPSVSALLYKWQMAIRMRGRGKRLDARPSVVWPGFVLSGCRGKWVQIDFYSSIAKDYRRKRIPSRYCARPPSRTPFSRVINLS